MSNRNSFEFESTAVSLFIDTSLDPIAQLENNKDMILDQLGLDKDAFLTWLSSVTITNANALKIETLQLLVSCWLTSKKLYSSIPRGQF
jgi:hypothetical protein